jgi:thiamine-monophosphate kinase
LSTPGSTTATLVSHVGERGLIERIRRRLPPAPPGVVIGIGDDAAVVAGGRNTHQVLTTDALVEGVHFDRRFSRPSDIGYKALAVNISDIVSMGATPSFALMSLMLPPDMSVEAVDGIVDGLLEMAGVVNVALIGGNITRSPGPLVVDVTVTGSVHPRKLLTRSGGRPGDLLYVSGSIGGAAAGLSWLRSNAKSPDDVPEDAALADCIRRHVRPEPRVRLGLMLGRNRAASACMDLSDGLADAVRQIAEASGTGATINAPALPIHEGGRSWFTSLGDDPVARSITGGDDYELLFAVAPRMKTRFRNAARLVRRLTLTKIGELTSNRTLEIGTEGRMVDLPSGFAHF